jgi:2,4'-dihydroxyacetophenone dioxygenase
MSYNATDQSQVIDPETIPWIPLAPGESFKPLCFLPDDQGRVILLRLDPGTLVPRHRHSGEVHCLNLRGTRKLLDSGEEIGPGGYVYEPAGNVDSWMATGDEQLLMHIVVYGTLEVFDDDGRVIRCDSAATMREMYQQYCQEQGIAARDLGGRGAA